MTWLPWLCVALCVLAAPARAVPSSTATLMGVDLYRCVAVAPQKVAQLMGPRIAVYMQHFNEGGTALKHAERLKAELENGVRQLGNFAYVGMSLSRHVSASDYGVYITFDVVDDQDAASRMPFNLRPEGRFPDPAGLLAQWRGYAELCADLRQGVDLVVQRPACPGFYCPWVQRTQEVLAFEKRFSAEVPPNKAALAQVLAQDADPRNRAAAAYLLSYSTNAVDLAELMLQAVRDPDVEVRAAALSVLSDIAGYAKGVFIEVPRLLPALDYPATSDRSKALAVFAGLAANPQYQAYIASRAALQLARLLRAGDPSVRDLAYTLLGMLSGRNYDRADFVAWDKWAVDASSPALKTEPLDAGRKP